MKVVLLKDVRNVGRAHAVVDVAAGYAINSLIPSKSAVPATPAAMKSATTHMEKANAQREVETALIKETLAHLAEGHLTIAKKVNEQGHLYDAVSVRDIAEAAKLPESVIRLEKPIKELGHFTIPVSYGEEFGEVALEVVSE